MEMYHGSDTTKTAGWVGLCLTDDDEIAAGYATEKNGGSTVTTFRLDLSGLSVDTVGYDYDNAEPIIPDDCTADVVEYEDCDMQGRSHRTWQILTPRGVGALVAA